MAWRRALVPVAVMLDPVGPWLTVDPSVAKTSAQLQAVLGGSKAPEWLLVTGWRSWTMPMFVRSALVVAMTDNVP